MSFAVKVNKNYKKLSKNYLFTQINEKKQKVEGDVISLGVGDVTMPIPEDVAKVMQQSLIQQCGENFIGYPPETGYEFLKQEIKKYYLKRNVIIDESEIFISNGIGCDITNILGLFDKNEILIPNPTYPAYFDSNIIQGNKIHLFDMNDDFEKFKGKGYIIYICSPNNPTGLTLNKVQLQKYIDFAKKTKSIIFYDIAYESFIQDDSVHFVYEVDTQKKYALEFGSFSKMAGFTNLRCSWTIVPKNIFIGGQNLNEMWARRQCTFFNGVPYFVQKGAQQVLISESYKKNIEYYCENAKILKQVLNMYGFEVCNYNPPYIWAKCINNMTSWQTFDFLLQKYKILCVPGSGFGSGGEGYIRFSAFAKREDILKAKHKLLSK